MRLPKFDRAATATLIAFSLMAIAGAFLVFTPWNLKPERARAFAHQNEQGEQPEGLPVVEVVFALDTTGSMSGLIESAKQKIWSIANQVSRGQPQPIVRFGLVFYRDKGDDYVTETVPLSTDIDAIYDRLLTASASGGGDGPEHVNKALDIAIGEMQWKTGPRVLKLVFLVGDAPPHDDYSDSPTSTELAKQAAKKGIVINAVRVGGQYDTEVAWKAIANAAGGKYASIAQDGGTVAVTTPFDSDLEHLNRALADSSVAFGSAEDRARAAARMDNRRRMKGEVAASAAGVSGSKGGHLGGGDFLSALEDGEVDIRNMPAAAKPEALRSLEGADADKWIAEKKAKRKALADRIATTSKKRAVFLKENKATKADSFDDNVGLMLKEQTGTIGVTVE